MQVNKITSHPPSKQPVEEFILGAEKRKASENNKIENNLPWLDPLVRKDLQKVFTAKLSEEYILKIKYISDRTNKSQQKIVREILCQEIDKIINDLI
ncbi:MAG: hypothetical protein K9G65_02440 [Rickettsiaceae bacterium]|nr:hypothetical protein [Rickettsiaceae bacterium]